MILTSKLIGQKYLNHTYLNQKDLLLNLDLLWSLQDLVYGY